eukprot:TRINITY_DN6360_c0_g1_i1.p2 TRINITY_DN6360_c0_g1~~TRINITY_DN6360_c0_g1_i1.p2  ORF type:complete len:71 (+),score=15.63 TRINITY_DN6360_c0_g1_i1:276-488(+)
MLDLKAELQRLLDERSQRPTQKGLLYHSEAHNRWIMTGIYGTMISDDDGTHVYKRSKPKKKKVPTAWPLV